MSKPVLALDSVYRRYPQSEGFLEVLKGVSLALYPGRMTALVGPSGSGKSTLLHIAGLLDLPDRGAVYISGRKCGQLGDAARTQLRRSTVGFVYQFHHLLPEFSAEENVAMPLRIAGMRKGDALARARALLGRLGLKSRLDHRPAELSGGEQQRVAICRALANRPKVLLADEPTGNLDPKTSEQVFQEMLHAAREEGVAALIATHNMELAKRMDHTVVMQDSQLRHVG